MNTRRAFLSFLAASPLCAAADFSPAPLRRRLHPPVRHQSRAPVTRWMYRFRACGASKYSARPLGLFGQRRGPRNW
jgi:hypothetical protein